MRCDVNAALVFNPTISSCCEAIICSKSMDLVAVALFFICFSSRSLSSCAVAIWAFISSICCWKPRNLLCEAVTCPGPSSPRARAAFGPANPSFKGALSSTFSSASDWALSNLRSFAMNSLNLIRSCISLAEIFSRMTTRCSSNASCIWSREFSWTARFCTFLEAQGYCLRYHAQTLSMMSTLSSVRRSLRRAATRFCAAPDCTILSSSFKSSTASRIS
mmetsp:Transcript_115733/g.373958  ORF Transcript_115733/g.373958 Transcript_115733/m.373958 type:complete len:219 (-) Transcript_115733:38-694(-)